MRVVITGATGNIGTSLVSALADEPAVDEIVGVARRRPAWQPPKTRWVTADIVTDDLTATLSGAAAVVHLAWAIQPARDLAAVQRVNVVGSQRVFEATARAGVGMLLHTSSVGAYSPGPRDRTVDETWPTHGIETSFYSRQKAYAERLLDTVEQREPGLRVVRVRPSIAVKGPSAAGLRRLFAGPFLPSRAVGRLPFAPCVRGLRLQLVHADDVAQALRLLLLADTRGAFNLAAEPILEPRQIAEALGSNPVAVSGVLARSAAALSFHLRLQPTPAGWVDMGLQVPLMDAGRACRELGWTPRHSATDTLAEVLDGLHDSEDTPTPPLSNATSGWARLRDVRTGVGGRSGA